MLLIVEMSGHVWLVRLPSDRNCRPGVKTNDESFGEFFTVMKRGKPVIGRQKE